MNSHFYIAYQTESQSFNYCPFDICLTTLASFDIAEIYISKFFQNLISENSLTIQNYVEPILVTNDIRLSLTYRNVFTYDEFFSYCVDCSKSESELLKLPFNLKYIALNSKLSGDNGITVFNHFKNIVEGKYKTAHTYVKYDDWTDEQNGITYNYEAEEGWRTNAETTQNTMLKKEFNYHDLAYGEINLSDYHFHWWHNLDNYWKEFFCYKVQRGIFGGIPTTGGLIDILELDDIDLNTYTRDMGKVSNIEPFKELKQLKALKFRNNNIQDLTPLLNIIHLQVLDCSNNLINNLEPLHDLNELEELDVSGNKLSKIEIFWGLNNIKKLILNNNKIEDLTFISKMPFLEHLEINSNNILDLTPLANLKRIKYLALSNNRIENLEPLRQLKTLEVLIIKNNKILSLEPLKKLESLNHLEFDNNDIITD